MQAAAVINRSISVLTGALVTPTSPAQQHEVTKRRVMQSLVTRPDSPVNPITWKDSRF